MCCFSPVSAPLGFLARLFPPKIDVSSTRIFARLADAASSPEQWLVYSMEISVGGEVAMILPIPVLPGSGERAVSFVDLSKHPGFFDDLAQLFTPPMPAAAKGGLPLRLAPQSRARLVVHEVGAFVASWVPTVDDFDRLDPRFRLPRSIWSSLGAYDDYGFAVFQLARGKKLRVHPMAFRFPTREPSRLFFPTVHVHDGKVHAEADFDHTLYYQADVPEGAPAAADERSFLTPARDAEGALVVGEPVRKRELHGTLPNRDTWIELTPSGPPAARDRNDRALESS
jgi:hypothetical protein